MTLTVNGYFGSGFVPPGTGVVMNNQMDDFSLEPGVPNLFGLVGSEANSVAAGKRPLSSMAPTIVRDPQGQSRILIGAAGGPRIPTAVFQALLARMRFSVSLPDAVSAPRFHHQWRPDRLQLEESAWSPEVIRALSEKGWEVKSSSVTAKIHALERHPDGRVWGVPDRRGEGSAGAE